jgi:ABC-2 type transport system ATP-binding protein
MISLRNVRFSYAGNGRKAQHGTANGVAGTFGADALDLAPGVSLLLGPNGAGKSTLLKLIAGVEQPMAGTVSIDGHDLWRDEVAARAALAYVPEHPDLTPYATVGEVLGLVCRLRGRPVAEGASALTAVGLDGLGDRSVRELSMGQRRRAVLAAAFIGTPTTLLLDEPLESMDRAMRVWLTTWITEASARGATIVVATHDIEPFVELASRAIVVRRGTAEVIDPLPADPSDRMHLLDRSARGELIASQSLALPGSPALP